MSSETKGLVHSSSEPLLPVILSASSSLTTIAENPKDAAARSKLIDKQLEAERRREMSDCTLWVTAPGNGIHTLQLWLQSYVRVRTTVTTSATQPPDVAWNDVYDNTPIPSRHVSLSFLALPMDVCFIE
jgi:hypothetical protein